MDHPTRILAGATRITNRAMGRERADEGEKDDDWDYAFIAGIEDAYASEADDAYDRMKDRRMEKP